MNDQDEMFELATETPAFLGCPAHMPKKLPSGFDGTEPGEKKHSNLETINIALIDRLSDISSKCLDVLSVRRQDRAGENAAELNINLLGALSEIRQMCDFREPERSARGEDAAPTKEERAEAYRMAHYTFGDGLFPIQRLNGVECVIERCVVNGREFKLTIEDASTGDQHFSKAKLRDNGKVVCYFFTRRGKAISEKMAHGALKAYVHNLSGSGKYHSRGGFLKQQIVRAAANQEVK